MGIESAFAVMQGVGAGARAVGAYNESRANKTAYNAQGQVAENNAQIAEWQAQDALARGDRAVYTQRLKTRQLKGTQRVRMAANNVDLGYGSAVEILTDTDYFGEMDAATLHDNAAKEAWALRNQARNFTSEASLMRNRAGMENPMLAGATSLLSSAGRVAGNWYSSPSGSLPSPIADNVDDGPFALLNEGEDGSQGRRRKGGVY